MDDISQRAAWPDWAKPSQSWRSHIIVSYMECGLTLERARETAKEVLIVASALASHVRADGFGWDGSGLFFPVQNFLDGVKRAPLPPHLMIRCQWEMVSPPRQGIKAATTRGLRFFGLLELRDLTGDQNAVSIATRLRNLGDDLIARGPVNGDGDTFGGDQRRTTLVRHEWNRKGQPSVTLSSNST